MEPDATREWHYEIEGIKKGPVSERRLLADRELGLLDDSTLIWTSDLEDWIEFGSLSLDSESNTEDSKDATKEPEPIDYSDPLVTCAWSGEERPQSEMLPFGEVWIAPEHREVFVQHLAETGSSPDIPMEGYPFPASLTLNTLLGQSFQIFGAQWKSILIFCFAVHGPLQLLIELLSRRLFLAPVVGGGEFDPSFSLTLYSIWGPIVLGTASVILIGSFVSAGLYAMTRDRWNGRSELEIGALFRSGLRNFPRVLLTRIFLYAIYFIAGAIIISLAFRSYDFGAFLILLALVIIGSLSIRLTSAEAFSVLEGKGGSWALGRSWVLTRRTFWKVVWYRLVIYIPIGILSVVAGLLLEIPFFIFQNFVAAAFVTTLLTLPTAFASVFEMILAIHLKANREKAKSSETN